MQPSIARSRVKVRVGPPRDAGALTPYTSGGLLMLGSTVPAGTPSPFGVNIDSSLMLDALDDGTVYSVEVLAPRPSWRRTKDAAPRPPRSMASGSIVLANLVPNTYIEVTLGFNLADPEPGDFTALLARDPSPAAHGN